MTHTYQISGMTCNGCRSHVQKTLSEVPGVTKAEVNLEEKAASIEMGKHNPLETFKAVLEKDGGKYSIGVPNGKMEETPLQPHISKPIHLPDAPRNSGRCPWQLFNLRNGFSAISAN